MKRSMFEQKIKMLKIGDYVTIVVRGNYGTYSKTRRIQKIEDGRIYFDSGFSHSYQRILDVYPTTEKKP